MKFVDRIDEIKFLEKEYKRKTSSFIVLYGRRRVGKTRLIKEFIKNKDSVYFLATEESEAENIKTFQNILYSKYKIPLLDNNKLLSWNDLFYIISTLKLEKKLIIVIDEFQYLLKSNKGFSSILQKSWDEYLKDKNIMLIISGSALSMIKREVLSYSSPLYGRRTGQMNLKPIKFKYFKEFFENKNIDLIKLYSLTGGIPKYVEILESKENIYDTIKENFLNVNSYLFEEPYFLLEKELKDIGSYFSIIKAIANGNNKLSKISTSLGIKQTSLSYYLNNLIELDILEREVPILEKNPQTSKKGIYKIKDNFLNFWFKFIYPYKSYIEIGNIDFVMNIIKKSFIERHVSFIYEDISKEKLIDLNLNDKLPVKLSKIGRWWDKNLEIDIVGVDRENKPILFGECKYTKKPVDLDVYYALVEKSKKLLKDNNQNNLYFAFFSYNGYTKNFIDKVKKEKNILIFEGDLSENN
ncbi:ATP-binding protein [Thermosipho africanus Ob7]|uniref:ATP-binding protein n=1 Tax=Thermosipho africanus TaxID=2421 RepID=UPI000E0BB9CF|nr:ATP-binding protein [Thermosipho africanus]RDI90859.1 ATP-binding protein [Thermosipho africanus Ob7]HCF38856.1 ATPase [Thermosipho africanus]